MYTLLITPPGTEPNGIRRIADATWIPLVEENTDYQQFLDDINEHGIEVVNGDIPAHVLTQAADKKFTQQLSKYAEATARLSQYVLSQGRAEIKQMIPTGERVFNDETLEMELVLAEVTTHDSIEPVPLTVEVSEMNTATMEMIITTVDNPVVIKDQEERAAAQAIIAATPPDVVTAYENSLET